MGAKEYSMRIWLNPDRLAAVNLSPIEVIDALKEQNTQVAAGRLNQPPSDTGAAFELLINARGRLETPDEFGDIIVKYTPDGRIIHLKDIARIELGAYSYSNESYINQKVRCPWVFTSFPEQTRLKPLSGCVRNWRR